MLAGRPRHYSRYWTQFGDAGHVRLRSSRAVTIRPPMRAGRQRRLRCSRSLQSRILGSGLYRQAETDHRSYKQAKAEACGSGCHACSFCGVLFGVLMIALGATLGSPGIWLILVGIGVILVDVWVTAVSILGIKHVWSAENTVSTFGLHRAPDGTVLAATRVDRPFGTAPDGPMVRSVTLTPLDSVIPATVALASRGKGLDGVRAGRIATMGLTTGAHFSKVRLWRSRRMAASHTDAPCRYGGPTLGSAMIQQPKHGTSKILPSWPMIIPLQTMPWTPQNCSTLRWLSWHGRSPRRGRGNIDRDHRKILAA